MGIGLWGLSPLREIGISKRSGYQMTTSRELAHGGAGEGARQLARLPDFCPNNQSTTFPNRNSGKPKPGFGPVVLSTAS